MYDASRRMPAPGRRRGAIAGRGATFPATAMHACWRRYRTPALRWNS